MIVIIEGPDLSGKSFAIEKIGKFFNDGFTLKNNYKPRVKFDEKIYIVYWDILRMLKDTNKGLIILDRFYPSQAVYSYMRGACEMNGGEISHLDAYCAQEGVKYIYLDTSLEDMEARYKERGDEHIKLEDLKKLKERYDLFFEKTELEKIKIDTTKMGWIETVKEFLEVGK